MLQTNYIRENKEDVIKRLSVKNFDSTELIEKIISIDDERKKIKTSLDETLTKANVLAKEIGELFKKGETQKANELKEQTKELKENEKVFNENLSSLEKEITDILLVIPNLPHASVPKGKSAEQNEIIFEENKNIDLGKNNLPHWDLAAKYDIIDFELGNKITGSGFPVYKGKGARLQRGLINFFLDEAVKAGYKEMQIPFFVNEASAYGTGQLPDKEGQMYSVPLDNFYLIPTAEVPVTNLYRDVILKAEDLPLKNCAYSSCFRREAGSYGKDVRGLNRLHQFDKVEIVQIQHPDKSYQTLDEMLEHVKGLLRKLELPFRIVKLCGGDMSFASALTFDFEVYSAAQKRWLEVSSVSNFETFQSNRMKLRFKDSDKKTKLAHTLNGSALALPRIVAALLENNQTENGIKLPKAIADYAGFEVI
ncbi:MAG: serine--tRNA ligase [Bacteroidales bacterium]|jgi:seryl-tRNA synthetase